MSGRRPGLPGDYLDSLMPGPAEDVQVSPQAGDDASRGPEAERPQSPASSSPGPGKASGPTRPRRGSPKAVKGASRSADEPSTTAASTPAAPPAPRARKERVTFQLDPRLVDEARDATVFLLTRGQPASLAGLVEGAIERELKRLRKEHLGGKAFPARQFAPPPGRRLGRP